MARLIQRSAESWSYILLADRVLKIDQQTRFVLRPLTQGEHFAFEDSTARTTVSAAGTSVMSRQKQALYELALSHIESVENFPVGAPKPWPADQEARATYLAQLENDDVQELGLEIFGRSRFGHADLKKGEPPKDGDIVGNSSPPGPTSSSGGTSAAETTAGPS